VAACTSSDTLSEKERVEIVREAKETLDKYYDDIRKEGLTAEFRYLDNSAEFFWVPPGYSSPLSYDSVAKILNQNAPLFRSINNSFDTVTIVPLTKELATYSGRLKSIVTDTAGAVTSFSLIETGILINRNDGWKLLSGQTSILPSIAQ
jgi:hypothetical protein